TDRLTKSRRWAGEREEPLNLARTLTTLVEKLQELERQQPAAIWQTQFETWQGLQRQSFENLPPAELNLLGEMYNGGLAARDRFVLELDRARNLLPRVQRFVDAASSINLFAAEADVEKELRNLQELGSQLEAQTRNALTTLEPMAARFQRWIATMAHCATLFSDPRDRLSACHDAGDWLGAINAFNEAFTSTSPADVPLSAVRRKLDGLARIPRRDEYRRALAEHRERLSLRDLHFDRLNEFCKHVEPAIAWVFVEGQATGSGFLAGADLVVTNLHVIVTGERPTAPDKITVHLGGASRSVKGMSFPARSGIDLVVLQLAARVDVRPLRVGYGSLIEVGERVLAIGFPLPEGNSFEENLLLDHGIVNRIRTRPDTGGRELELGLRIFPGMSGGPVFSDRGEVVAVSTFVRYMSAGGQQGTFVDKSSHAIAATPIHDLLPRPW
ncbi:MAG TPA: serine protease, partial [Polyangiaceae bacterium]|nr:serine protease [Polyangiaceae bacterium]